MENGFTQSILNDYGSLRLAKRLPNGMTFKRPNGHNLAVLGNHPVHTIESGELVPIQAMWQADGNGNFRSPHLLPTITPEEAISFPGQNYLRKTVGVGLVSLNPLSFTVLETFSNPGQIIGSEYIREAGIYQNIFRLHERNRLKEDVIVQEKPPQLDGDYFVIGTRILESFLPDNYEIEDGFVHGGSIQFRNGFAHDANDNRIRVRQYIRTMGSQKWLLSGVPTSWMDTAVYPVTIDPIETFQPDSAGYDAWGDEAAPTDTMGSDADFWVGKQNSSDNRASWIKFDLSSINDFNTIIDATLTLYANYVNPDPSMYIRHYALRRNWAEASVCWSYYSGTTAWSQSPGLNTTLDSYSDYYSREWISKTAPVYYDFDVTNHVGYFLDGSRANYGWLMWGVVSENSSGTRFSSSDSTTPAYRPKLVVEYVARQLGGLPLFFS